MLTPGQRGQFCDSAILAGEEIAPWNCIMNQLKQHLSLRIEDRKRKAHCRKVQALVFSAAESIRRKGSEKAMKATISLLFSITIFTSSICAQSKELQGVWRIEEIATSGETSKAQPSMYVFTKNHYSIIRIASSGPRKQLADDSKATAQELLEVYVDSFISNAGTYELNKGKLTVRPMVAKDPGTMVPGIYIRYNVKVQGNTLTLVEESNSWGGTLTNAPVFKLVRLE